ncbi:MAG: Recombinase family protein [Lachnoclostridium sp.]
MRVAAYCRVSTDQDEQLLSYENQVRYYTDYIKSRDDYEFVDVYADEGISGTSTKKREDFLRMIEDCDNGKIDFIITKSISRFARNTKDCLEYYRRLKGQGIGIFFEKENINTLESQGEVLLTILSSLAQEESRTISENCKWGIQRRMEQGYVRANTAKFTGYDRDENGNLVINEEQAEIVKRIYREYLDGRTVDYIARSLEVDEIKNWEGKVNWLPGTIDKILMNEKYKGDALLQKNYTVDYLSKKRIKNNGQIKQYYVEGSHEAIIDEDTWECAQLERARRKEYMYQHGLSCYAHKPDENPFAGKVICASCGQAYGRKSWNGKVVNRKVWQCGLRYRRKGVIGCDNRHVDDEVFPVRFMESYNMLIENKQQLLEKWKRLMNGDDLLKKYKAKEFIGIVSKEGKMQVFNPDIMLKMLDHILVYKSGKIAFLFYDGTIIEWEKE